MARFDKLEFGSPEPAPEPGQPPRSDRDAAYWLTQADQCRRGGRYENALQYYSRALEQDKSLFVGWLGQVQMLILLEEPAEAELWARKALELFPNHGDLLAARAQAGCRSGDLKQAYGLCDASMKQPGQSAYRWLARGEVMVASGQDRDRACFDKAQQLEADWLVPLEIAMVYLYYHVPSLALTRSRRAVEAAPDNAYAWYIQGLSQHQCGLSKQARASWQRCLELEPRHAEAQHRLHETANDGWSPGRLWRRLFH